MGIKNVDAFVQKCYSGTRGLKCLDGGIGTDRDLRLHYSNKIDQLIEFKKKTKNHTVSEFLKTNQFELQKKDADELNCYFFYCLHDEPIDKSLVINSDLTIINFAYHNKKILPYYNGLYLIHAQEDLYNLYNDKFTYHVKVTYPNGSNKFCKNKNLLNKLWICDTKEEALKFKSYEEAYKYVHDRFKKSFNMNNTYAIYSTNGDELIAEYSYNPSKNTLSIARESKTKMSSSTVLVQK